MKILSRNNIKYLLILILAIGLGYYFALGGVKIGIVFLMIPPIILFLIYSFEKPELLMHLVIFLAFSINGLSRYIPSIPFGLSIDALLVMVIVVLIFNKSVNFQKEVLTNALSLALICWLMFTFVELFNPLARSKAAWFYANRGFSFYPLLFVVLAIYVYKKPSHLNAFLILWAIFSAIGTIWGIKQLFLGVSVVEKQWLNAGAASTHILFGKLRVFSYYSDAAQFGASQAHTSLVFGIIGLFSGKLKYRMLFFFMALLSLYGMLISGTRGALAILAIGGFVYFVMTKNFRIVIAGMVFAAGMFGFLKYTTIMQSNYQVSRLRSSLNADDPSLKVRKDREKVLAGYLADKPLGGGIGSAGYWGKRFSPGTYLAELGTDGHYTRIWMECGIIGLYLYYLMLLVIFFYLGRMLWVMPISKHRHILLAFYSGFAGVCVASYTNGLLTQVPTGPLVFIGLAFVYMGAKTTNKEIADEEVIKQDLNHGTV